MDWEALENKLFKTVIPIKYIEVDETVMRPKASRKALFVALLFELTVSCLAFGFAYTFFQGEQSIDFIQPAFPDENYFLSFSIRNFFNCLQITRTKIPQTIIGGIEVLIKYSSEGYECAVLSPLKGVRVLSNATSENAQFTVLHTTFQFASTT